MAAARSDNGQRSNSAHNDGHNLLFRACFGTPAQIWSRDHDRRDITTQFMFFALLRKAVNDELGTWPEILVVFDGEEGSAERREADPGYKANRPGGDDALRPIRALGDVQADPAKTRTAVPKAVAEKLAHEQDSVLLAGVPRAEDRAHERADHPSVYGEAGLGQRLLYGAEPCDASILTRLKALPEPFADRLHGQARHFIRTAAWAGEWDKALQMLLAGLAESKAPVSPAEHDELSALPSAIGEAVSRLRPSLICGAQP